MDFGFDMDNSSERKITKGRKSFETILNTVSKQSIIIFSSKMAFNLMLFASSILLARQLGAKFLGQYQLGLVVIQLLGTLCFLGFNRGFVRYIPMFYEENMGKIKSLLRDNVAISGSFSIGLSILLFSFSDYISYHIFKSHEMSAVLRIFSFFLPVYTVYYLGLSSLVGFKRADVSSLIENILIPFIFITLLTLALLFGGQLFEIVLFRILSRLIGILFICYYLYRNFRKLFRADFVKYNTSGYIAYALPLLLISILNLLISRVTVLMLGSFVEPDQIGIYAVSAELAVFSIFALQAVGTIFSPYISELYTKKDFTNLEKLLKVLTKWIFYFSAFITAVIILFNKELLSIYGESFTAGSAAVVILSFGQLINSLTGPTGNILIMTGRQKWEVLNSVCTLILTISFNLYLIPKYGIMGAAISYGLSVSIINVMKLIETYKELKMHPYSFHYFKGIIAILASSLFVFLLSKFFSLSNYHYIIVLAVGGTILFASTIAVYYLLKLDEEDLFIINKLYQKFNLR